MKKLLPILLLALSGYGSAGTLTISCENAIATKADGSTSVIKQSSLSSDGEKSVLVVDGHQTDLPLVTQQFGGYIIRTIDKNNMTLTVTGSDGFAPHTAALFVSMEDENGNAIWSLMGAGCKSRKTK